MLQGIIVEEKRISTAGDSEDIPSAKPLKCFWNFITTSNYYTFHYHLTQCQNPLITSSRWCRTGPRAE